MTVPIIVIAGQSNAVGRGILVSIPNYLVHGYDRPYTPVQYLYQVEDEPTDPLVWDYDDGPIDLTYIPSGNGLIGVEASMSRRLVAHGYSHAVAKMGIGSSSLGEHWKTTGTYPAGDNLFTQFLAFCNTAETSLSGTIAELVWIQGETDAGNSGYAAAYAANFLAFIEAFRVEFPGVPVTINRLHASAGGNFNITVRAQQDTIARTIPGVRIFSADDLPLTGAHYTTIGFLALGERFADAILSGREDRGLFPGPRSGMRVGPKYSSGHNFPPIADFSTSAAALTVTFTDESTDLEAANARWLWDFGDGSTSSTQSPSHAYASEGTYTVALTVSDAKGATSTKTATVSPILWSIDATSGKAVPATEDEWDNLVAAESLVVGAPQHIWLFQDASGNLAAALGGKTLTASGTFLYQQTETGWSRKFITSNTAVAAANRSAENATMSATTEAVVLLVYGRCVTPVNAHQRACYGGSSNNAMEAVGGAAGIRYRTGASALNSATDHTGQVLPYVIVHDPSGTGRMGLYSPLAKLEFDSGTSPAYAARAGTTVRFTFSLGTDATSNFPVGYGAGWSGATVQFADLVAVRAAVRALLESLNWPVTGW